MCIYFAPVNSSAVFSGALQYSLNNPGEQISKLPSMSAISPSISAIIESHTSLIFAMV